MRKRLGTRPPGFFAKTMGEDLLDRFDGLALSPGHAAVVGAHPLIAAGLQGRGWSVECIATLGPNDDLNLDANTCDLIASSGFLDVIDDLPGVLVQMKRALKPGGRLLANLAAAPSLTALRIAVAAADDASGRAIARFHPLVDVRGGGDLLARAGFTEPVADVDTMTVAYASVETLLADLRDAASRNLLIDRRGASKTWFQTVSHAFTRQRSADDRTHETLSWVTLSARSR